MTSRANGWETRKVDRLSCNDSTCDHSDIHSCTGLQRITAYHSDIAHGPTARKVQEDWLNVNAERKRYGYANGTAQRGTPPENVSKRPKLSERHGPEVLARPHILLRMYMQEIFVYGFFGRHFRSASERKCLERVPIPLWNGDTNLLRRALKACEHHNYPSMDILVRYNGRVVDITWTCLRSFVHSLGLSVTDIQRWSSIARPPTQGQTARPSESIPNIPYTSGFTSALILSSWEQLTRIPSPRTNAPAENIPPIAVPSLVRSQPQPNLPIPVQEDG